MQLLIQANSSGTHPSSWPSSTPGEGRVWVGASFSSQAQDMCWERRSQAPITGPTGLWCPLGFQCSQEPCLGKAKVAQNLEVVERL